MVEDERVTPHDVAEFPYWRTCIRLGEYKRDRIALARLEPTLAQIQIRLRGWYFPHIPHDPKDRLRSAEFIEAWSNYDSYELWRFYRSAQLFHLKNLVENLPESKPQVETITKRRLNWQKPDWSRVAGYVDIIRALYHVAETFEFGSRLCGSLDYRGQLEISLSLVGIKNCVLTITDESRSWDHLYQYRESRLDDVTTVDAQSLMADSGSHALSALYRIFFRFSWDAAPQSVLAKEIRAFMRR